MTRIPHVPKPPAPECPPRPTTVAQWMVAGRLRPGDCAVDATAGQGHDTCFLAGLVGPGGRVLALDIQQSALDATQNRLTEMGLADGRVQCHLNGHENLASLLQENEAAVVMFNLGYLPGHDHQITTQRSSTLAGLEAAARVLRPGGLLSVLCYPGHPGGETEAQAVEAHLLALATNGWRLARYGLPATRRPSPFLLAACKPG